MTLPEIAHHRLVSQQLHSTAFKNAPQLVSYMGAVQGQEYGPSKWGLGLRLPNLTDADVERDFTDGQLLRTHLLRPTWHFVTAEEIRWLLMLTAPRVNAINQFTYRQQGLTDSDFKRTNTIIAKTLDGGQHLTRDAINEALQKNKIEASGVKLVAILMQAELDGIVCSGARQGKKFTYALLEDRVPKINTKTRDEALAELTLRYFTSRGPATVKDFSTWSGLTMSDCKKGLEMTGNRLAHENVGGEMHHFHEQTVSKAIESDRLYLLPIYDEMVMGYKNRDAMLQFVQKHNHKMDIVFDNMIIFDGQIIGSWKRVIKTKNIEVTYNFLEKPTKKQRTAFEKCLARFEQFNALPVIYKPI